MNAYEYLKPGAIVPVTNQAVKDLVDLAKQQTDLIAELEKDLHMVERHYDQLNLPDGYDRVMADLDVAIADKVNRLVSRAVMEDSEE